MKMLAVIGLILVVFFIAACAPKCGQCIQLAPLGPSFCSDGETISGGIDDCGCQQPPKCQEKTICAPESKQGDVCTSEYHQICGWFKQSMLCFAYPCAQNFDNPCMACHNENVAYWTEGPCPKVQ